MSKTSLPLRWLSLIIVLANVAYNYFYTEITTLPRVEENSDRFDNLFTPAGYAFSIWGLIYLAFLIYAVGSLLPSQRGRIIYDKQALSFIGINILGSAWITAFNTNNIGLSVIIIFLSVAVGIFAFVRIQHHCTTIAKTSISVPFSMYAAWICVASIANTASYFISIDFQPPLFSEVIWTMIMITVSALIGILTTRRFHAPVFGSVIIWALVAIYFKQNESVSLIANFAAGSALAVLISVVTQLVWNAKLKQAEF